MLRFKNTKFCLNCHRMSRLRSMRRLRSKWIQLLMRLNLWRVNGIRLFKMNNMWWWSLWRGITKRTTQLRCYNNRRCWWHKWQKMSLQANRFNKFHKIWIGVGRPTRIQWEGKANSSNLVLPSNVNAEENRIETPKPFVSDVVTHKNARDVTGLKLVRHIIS